MKKCYSDLMFLMCSKISVTEQKQKLNILKEFHCFPQKSLYFSKIKTKLPPSPPPTCPRLYEMCERVVKRKRDTELAILLKVGNYWHKMWGYGKKNTQYLLQRCTPISMKMRAVWACYEIFKSSLIIKTSTANVQRRFSVLNLLYIKEGELLNSQVQDHYNILCTPLNW